MTQRERRLAIFLGAVVLLGGLFLAYQLILRPLGEYGSTIATLDDDVKSLDEQVAKVRKDKPQLETWRLMSLPIDPAHPGDVRLARGEYGQFLTSLLERHRFAEVNLTPMATTRSTSTQPGKKPMFIPVDFNLRAKASLPSLVQMLEEFQRTPLMHKIKNLTIDRPENAPAARRRGGDALAVEMTIEALVVSGAERRPTNLLGVDHRLLALDALTVLGRGPAALALVPSVLSPTGPLGTKIVERQAEAALARGAPPPKYDDLAVRNYRDIGRKNIFQGAPAADKPEVFFGSAEDIEVTRFTFLTDITVSDWKSEAFYYIRTNNRKTRLRVSPGFNTFRITDDRDDVIVTGKVVKIDARDIYFQVGESFYGIHVGQSFADAMRRRLPESEVRSLGLISSPGKTENAGKSSGAPAGRPTSLRAK
jgi:hypothetical protein